MSARRQFSPLNVESDGFSESLSLFFFLSNAFWLLQRHNGGSLRDGMAQPNHKVEALRKNPIIGFYKETDRHMARN